MFYRIIKEKSLLIDILEGSVNLETLKKITVSEISDPDFIHVKRILSDIRNANLNLTPADLEEFTKVLQHDNTNPDFKWAIITENPHSTAMSVLLQQDKSLKAVIGIFSGLTAASVFLGQRVEETDFRRELFKKF